MGISPCSLLSISKWTSSYLSGKIPKHIKEWWIQTEIFVAGITPWYFNFQCTVPFQASVCVRFLLSHWPKQATCLSPESPWQDATKGHGHGCREASINRMSLLQHSIRGSTFSCYTKLNSTENITLSFEVFVFSFMKWKFRLHQPLITTLFWLNNNL